MFFQNLLRLMIAGVIISFAACNNDIESRLQSSALVQSCIDNATDTAALLRCVPEPVLPAEKDDTATGTTVQEVCTDSDGNSEDCLASRAGEQIKYECTTTTYEGNRNPSDLMALNPNVDVTWVGALIQGISIPTGNLDPIPAPRKGGRIILEGVQFANGATSWVDVSEPSQSAMRDAVDAITKQTACSRENFFAGVSGCDCWYTFPSDHSTRPNESLADGEPCILSTTAQANYKIFQAKSTEQISAQLSLSIGSSGDVPGTSKKKNRGSFTLDITGEFNMSEAKNTAILNFDQVYYTINWETPQSEHAFINEFSPLYNHDALKKYMWPGNPPGYVSMISYGRRVLMTLQSSESYFDIQAALDAGCKSGSLEVSGGYTKLVQESTITMSAWGGSAESALEMVGLQGQEAIDAVNDFIRSGAGYSLSSPGAAIGYQIRWISSLQPARISLFSEYDDVVCEPIDPTNKVAAGVIETDMTFPVALAGHASVSTPTNIYVFHSNKNIYKGSFGGSFTVLAEAIPAANFAADVSNLAAAVNDNIVYLSREDEIIYANLDGLEDVGLDFLDFFAGTTPTLPHATTENHQLIVYGGHLYVIGTGVSGSQKVYVYGIDTDNSYNGTFSEASMTTNRANCSAVITNGYLYVLGGSQAEFAVINTDSSLGSFALTGSTTDEQNSSLSMNNSAAYAKGSFLYYFAGGGGTQQILYSLIGTDGGLSGDWTNNKNLLSALRDNLTLEYQSGSVYLIGGVTPTSVESCKFIAK